MANANDWTKFKCIECGNKFSVEHIRGVSVVSGYCPKCGTKNTENKSIGYIEKNKKVESKTKAKETAKAIDKMTVLELKEIAKGIPGVKGISSMRKAELVEIVKSNDA